MPDRTFSRTTVRRASVAVLVAVGAVLALAAPSCDSGSSTTTTTTTTTQATTASTAPADPSLAAPCGRAEAAPATYDHVVVLVEENRTWSGGRTPAVGMGFNAATMPFLHGLATKCAYYKDWAETDGQQNSLNQYIGMTSGVANTSTVNDCTPSASCHSEDDNLFRQVRTSGGTARSFVDGATQPCSPGTNASKHIPALYYWGGNDQSHCAAEVRPLGELDPDALPTFAFVVPDLCHDGHDCPDSTVDTFAKDTLGPILDGASYRQGRTLVVVIYDEDQPVPNLLIAPTAKAGAIATPTGTHAALLKTIESALGLPVLAQGQLPAAISLRPSAGI